MVAGNPPRPLAQTYAPAAIPGIGCGVDSLARWDARYAECARRWPKFLIRAAIQRELVTPPLITAVVAQRILGSLSRIQSRNPEPLSDQEVAALTELE